MGLRQELSSFYSAIGRPSIAPAARWTGAHGGQAFFAYSTNYLIDVENAIIVDVEPTTAIRQAEVLAAKRSRYTKRRKCQRVLLHSAVTMCVLHR
jgi:hypothetical protein